MVGSINPEHGIGRPLTPRACQRKNLARDAIAARQVCISRCRDATTAPRAPGGGSGPKRVSSSHCIRSAIRTSSQTGCGNGYDSSSRRIRSAAVPEPTRVKAARVSCTRSFSSKSTGSSADSDRANREQIQSGARIRPIPTEVTIKVASTLPRTGGKKSTPTAIATTVIVVTATTTRSDLMTGLIRMMPPTKAPKTVVIKVHIAMVLIDADEGPRSSLVGHPLPEPGLGQRHSRTSLSRPRQPLCTGSSCRTLGCPGCQCGG